MITFIESGNRIATENFVNGQIYTITYTNGNYRIMCCIGNGTDFVMFQGTSPNALFCLTLGTAETVSTIELGGGGSGTMNYNELENKPQINGIVLIGNKKASDLNLVSQTDLDNYVTDTELSTELADYATNASVVSALASKQDTLTTAQLTAVNSGITRSLVSQITTNQNNISKITPVTLSKRHKPQSADYEIVSDLTISIPGGKKYLIHATAMFNNVAPKGVIINKTNAIATNKNTVFAEINGGETDYGGLSASAIMSNTGSTAFDVCIFAKFKSANTSGSDVIVTYQDITENA